ncbi:MAG: short-chain fatty acid transporter [Acidobacteria bacterium]|nr:short-chain fatty acid transporter [Acidobacteriota bacterium]
MERVIAAITRWSTRWIPNAFVIACLLTLFTFTMVLFASHKTPVEALGYWTQGFWQLLEFAMQMSLIVLTGYMVAVSPPASRLLNALAGVPKTARMTVGLMGLVSMGLSWVHWGLGLVGAPIFLRFLIRKHPDVDYRLVVAAGYLGLACTWHAGLSGSAPLLMATPKHFMEGQVGLVPMSTTTFSTFNLCLTAVVVLVITATVVAIYPRQNQVRANPRILEGFLQATNASSGSESAADVIGPAARETAPFSRARASFSPANFLETSYTLNLVMGLAGLAALVTLTLGEDFHISLNVFNFAFLFLALLLHPNPASVVRAAAQGAEFLHGIILQFPFYAGMYGLIHYSGLAVTIGNWFVSIANAHTFPVIIYWYSGILSYFIPSGGSKWAVEAPYVLSAARSLGVPVQQAILSYAWGDMSTHFVQPFWAIPLLSIAKLEFKDILGYLGILFVVNGVVVSLGFLLMPIFW